MHKQNAECTLLFLRDCENLVLVFLYNFVREKYTPVEKHQKFKVRISNPRSARMSNPGQLEGSICGQLDDPIQGQPECPSSGPARTPTYDL